MPRASQHLQYSTWPQRGDPTISPIAAWHRARPLDLSNAPRGHARVPAHDEVRYDPESGTVLWLREDVLTTCYDLEEVTNDHGQAALEAVEAQYGPINDSERLETPR